MEINLSEVNGFHVVSIEGDVDLNSSPKVRETFKKLVDQSSPKVIVNFEKVTYVDSSGLATFIELMQRLKKNAGSMSLVQMSDKIYNLFEVTKLNKLFTIYKTQEEALVAS